MIPLWGAWEAVRHARPMRLRPSYGDQCGPEGRLKSASFTPLRDYPHASLGDKPPAAEVFMSAFPACRLRYVRRVPPATLAPRPALS